MDNKFVPRLKEILDQKFYRIEGNKIIFTGDLTQVSYINKFCISEANLAELTSLLKNFFYKNASGLSEVSILVKKSPSIPPSTKDLEVSPFTSEVKTIKSGFKGPKDKQIRTFRKGDYDYTKIVTYSGGESTESVFRSWHFAIHKCTYDEAKEWYSKKYQLDLEFRKLMNDNKDIMKNFLSGKLVDFKTLPVHIAGKRNSQAMDMFLRIWFENGKDHLITKYENGELKGAARLQFASLHKRYTVVVEDDFLKDFIHSEE